MSYNFDFSRLCSISSTQCSKNFVPLGNAALDSEAHIDSIKNSLILEESEKRGWCYKMILIINDGDQDIFEDFR